jgi:hypothetical protein
MKSKVIHDRKTSVSPQFYHFWERYILIPTNFFDEIF